MLLGINRRNGGIWSGKVRTTKGSSNGFLPGPYNRHRADRPRQLTVLRFV